MQLNQRSNNLLDPILPFYSEDLNAENKCNFIYIWGKDIFKGPSST